MVLECFTGTWILSTISVLNSLKVLAQAATHMNLFVKNTVKYAKLNMHFTKPKMVSTVD